MSEVLMCCGTTCDKHKARGDQLRVVSAFDELDHRATVFNGESPTESIQELEAAFERLRLAVAVLREN